MKLFAALLVSLLALTLPVVVSADAAPCVPFAQKDVPDETRPEWKLTSAYKIFDGLTTSQIGYRRYYRTDSGLGLGVYEYFGQLAFKAWACRNSGEDPVTKEPKDHMIAIPDGRGGWHIANIQPFPNSQFFDIFSHRGILVGVSIVLQESPQVNAPVWIITRPSEDGY